MSIYLEHVKPHSRHRFSHGFDDFNLRQQSNRKHTYYAGIIIIFQQKKNRTREREKERRESEKEREIDRDIKRKERERRKNIDEGFSFFPLSYCVSKSSDIFTLRVTVESRDESLYMQ